MKKGSNIIFIIVGAFLLLIAIIAIVLWSNKRFNWYETYEIKSKEPYGAFIMGEMLKKYYPEKKFTVLDTQLKNPLSSEKNKHQNYVFIGSKIEYDSVTVSALLAFVEQGNTAFISAHNVNRFLDELFPDTCYYYDVDFYQAETDSVVKLNFFNTDMKNEKDFQLTYVFQNQSYTYAWKYLDSSLFCGNRSNAAALGYINKGYFNFVKVHHGSGDFYIHSTPLAFSNYSLTKKENLEYVSKVFSFIPPGDILWDEYSKIPGNLSFNSDLESSQSPLRFILTQEGLRWAWYLSLLFLLLYVIFFGKRKQRVIPLLEPNTNTSLEYVNIIGQLYYQAQGHKTICLHKMKLFHIFIRSRYFINVNKPDEETIRNISLKSQIQVTDIKKIFSEYNRINTPAYVTSEELIIFHNLIENFYKNCK